MVCRLRMSLVCVEPTSHVVVHGLPAHDDGGHARGVDDAAVQERGVRRHHQDGRLVAANLLALDRDGHAPRQVGPLADGAQDRPHRSGYKRSTVRILFCPLLLVSSATARAPRFLCTRPPMDVGFALPSAPPTTTVRYYRCALPPQELDLSSTIKGVKHYVFSTTAALIFRVRLITHGVKLLCCVFFVQP